MGRVAVRGPVLGAVLTHADLVGTTWRAAFLVNPPPSVALALALLLVTGRRTGRAWTRRARPWWWLRTT